MEAYCMSDAEVAAIAQPVQQLRHLPGEMFLKGPVPWDWLVVAGRLKGSALQVGITLWHLSGLARSRTVRFRLSRVEEMGVTQPDGVRPQWQHAGAAQGDREAAAALGGPPLDGSTQSRLACASVTPEGRKPRETSTFKETRNGLGVECRLQRRPVLLQ
jgi:hypothetical protein